MRDVTFVSRALQRDMQYRVFMPETAQGRRLPVVYLLHGGGGTFHDWSNYSDVARFAGNGLLLVMPQGDYSYHSNAALRPTRWLRLELAAVQICLWCTRGDGGPTSLRGTAFSTLRSNR
jgi:poly(3-hydroxybutyrate) depolymerase